MLCATCSFDSPEGMRFCGQCGKPLVSACDPSSGTHSAERRQVTVLFCDIVESMALSERLDPEDLREILLGYQRAANQVVERFGGHTAQHLGDGLLVYFGYPVAHEGDPRRAVHTGLGIVDAIHELNDSLERDWRVRLAVRVGIHTGAVVAGEIGSGEVRERLALGQVPNVAARLQSLAEPGTVVVSGTTWSFIQGFFNAQPLGPQSLKGIARPVEVHRVLEESGVRNAFELAMARGLSPMVGRQDELSVLLGALEQVREGRGRVVQVVGEAGLGKSRLIHLLRTRAAGDLRWLVCRCSPFLQQSPFAPVADLLQGAFHLQPGELPASQLRGMAEGLASLGLPSEESLPLLAPLLGISVEEQEGFLGLTAQRRKEKTLEALRALLSALAEREPVIFAVEDLHWIDPSTLELLESLVRNGLRDRILVLLTFRPVFTPPWGAGGFVAQVKLDRLQDREVEVLAQGVSGGTLPREVLRQIVSKTDGVPLFVEELTKMVLGSGLLRQAEESFELTGPIAPLAIPATLQDSLMARLDRLSSIREVVQVASVLGREFTWEMIRATCALPAMVLQRELEQLVDEELLYQQGTPPGATYMFKHALIQDAAYESLLKSARQQHHLRIAQIFEERFPEVARKRPELIARHYTEGAAADRAVPLWLHAGRHAVAHSAFHEAIAHLERGISLLGALPDGNDRDRLELSLRTLLGSALIATRGYTHSPLEGLYVRAQELCSVSGEDLQLFWVLRGLWIFRLVRVELAQALDLGRRMMEIAEAREAPPLLFEAHLTLALSHFYLGELGDALAHLESGIALDSPDRDRSATFATGQDVAVTTVSMSALVLWQTGRFSQAVQRSSTAIEMARAIGHPYSLADALSSATRLHYLLRDPEAVEPMAADLLALSEEKGFQHIASYGYAYLGWAYVVGGDPARREAGFEHIHRGLSSFRASGALLSQLKVLFLLVEAHLHAEQTAEAERLLLEIRRILKGVDDRFFWLPELFRLEGTLALASPESYGRQQPEHCFRRALVLARRQGSKPFAMRAELELALLEDVTAA
ncbi:MAG: hypothetical protein QOH06_134 [Acidobacteriota bacterium]|jgi:class 3 adenylate cyclase/tetratricopeptide (TPR) repeat protein|nr:hypothetical protein [Acidobacteriota bacterium]